MVHQDDARRVGRSGRRSAEAARGGGACGVTIEKILLTHGHIDHCGEAGTLAKELGVPIEGPHEADRYWIARLEDDGRSYGVTGRVFEPDRWLDQGDTVTVGELTFDVYHCPGHTPGHVVFHHPPSKLALVGDVLFAGSIGRTDFPLGNHQDLLDAIVTRLWPLGGETALRARPWPDVELRRRTRGQSLCKRRRAGGLRRNASRRRSLSERNDAALSCIFPAAGGLRHSPRSR